MVRWELRDRENQVENQNNDEHWRLGGFHILTWKWHSWPLCLQRCMDSTFRRNSFGWKRTGKLSWQMCCWEQTELQLDMYQESYWEYFGIISATVGQVKIWKSSGGPLHLQVSWFWKIGHEDESIIIKKSSKIEPNTEYNPLLMLPRISLSCQFLHIYHI